MEINGKCYPEPNVSLIKRAGWRVLNFFDETYPSFDEKIGNFKYLFKPI